MIPCSPSCNRVVEFSFHVDLVVARLIALQEGKNCGSRNLGRSPDIKMVC